MMISLDNYEATVVREILASSLTQLRIESARADSHDFREALHARERIVEHVLSKVVDETANTAARESLNSHNRT